MMSQTSHQQIAKNTLFLYMRMLVSIAVNLYTIRLLWRVLGIDNYGIYNVVGGIVMMFAFLNSAMIASSQRFISYELGGGNAQRLKKTFSISLTVHFLLAIIILLLGETVGLWFLNVKMNIPEGRMVAANWVYQCSIISFLFTVISVPYDACIVAHEHMKIYGYFGILEVILKLIIVLIVAILPFDKLISYALLVLAVAIIMRLIYGIYCSRHFEECKFRRFKDSDLMKQMFSFAGWSFLGSMGYTIKDQGTNIIINLFFNVAVNAAKGVATQVGSVVSGFASNFTMALNPQITKNYAMGQKKEMLSLMFKGCKFSFILMGLMVVPILVCAPLILKLWIGDVAPYTVGFLQLTLLVSLIECVVSPITTSLQATGKIKVFQITVAVLMLATLPISWILLKIFNNPYLVIVSVMVMSAVALFCRLLILHGFISFSYKEFFRKVYGRSVPIIILTLFLGKNLYSYCSQNFGGLVVFAALTITIYIVLMYFLGLTKSEKNYIESVVKRKLHIKH